MTITIRLDQQLEQSLEALAEREQLSKSALIRQCLVEFLQKKERETTAWELGQEVFGKYGSGKGDLSVNRKKILREKLHAKRNSH